MLRTSIFLLLGLSLLITPGTCLCHCAKADSGPCGAHRDVPSHEDHAPACPAKRVLDRVRRVEMDQLGSAVAVLTVSQPWLADRCAAEQRLAFPLPSRPLWLPLYISFCTLLI